MLLACGGSVSRTKRSSGIKFRYQLLFCFCSYTWIVISPTWLHRRAHGSIKLARRRPLLHVILWILKDITSFVSQHYPHSLSFSFLFRYNFILISTFPFILSLISFLCILKVCLFSEVSVNAQAGRRAPPDAPAVVLYAQLKINLS